MNVEYSMALLLLSKMPEASRSLTGYWRRCEETFTYEESVLAGRLGLRRGEFRILARTRRLLEASIFFCLHSSQANICFGNPYKFS